VKILVTGGAGFIGSHLVDALITAGHRVRVLDNLDAQVHGAGALRPAHLHPAAELLVGDVRNRSAVARALDGVEAVFHEAAAVGVGQSMYQIEHYVSVNTVGAAVLLEGIALRRQQLRKLVVASSMSLYGEGAYQAPDGRIVHPPLRTEAALAARRFELSEGHAGQELAPIGTPEDKPLQPTSIYAITKRDHEEMFLAVGAAYDIPVVALRYFNVYGPRQALSNPYTGVVAIFSSRLLNRRPPLLYEDGRQTRDFVHVSDIVQANLLALGCEAAGGRIYNVGTGRATSVLQVAETLSELLDFAEKPEVLGTYRAGDIRHCVADISRIERELGYRPKVAFADGLRELLAWLRTQSADDAVEAASRELAARGLTR
jgi:dTDP-L-rhamnose 4-epimerase